MINTRGIELIVLKIDLSILIWSLNCDTWFTVIFIYDMTLKWLIALAYFANTKMQRLWDNFVVFFYSKWKPKTNWFWKWRIRVFKVYFVNLLIEFLINWKDWCSHLFNWMRLARIVWTNQKVFFSHVNLRFLNIISSIIVNLCYAPKCMTFIYFM